jgi:NtrC-family two-component system sensor histidine kinase KinB
MQELAVMNVEERTEEARASLELLYGIGREVAAALDLRTVLHRLLFLSMNSVGAGSGSIIVLDENNQPVESAFLMRGQESDTTALQLRVTYERGMAGWVARNRQAVLVPDTSKDVRWFRRPDDAKERTGPKSAVSAPIMAREKLVGVITLVHPRPNFFSSDHLDLIRAIADQAGTAIRNAQLFESLQVAHRRYRELFEDSIDPIFITNWEGYILEANRQAANTIGMSGAELGSMSMNELHDVDLEKVGSGYKNLFPGDPVTYESILHCCNSRNVPIEVYVRSIQTEDESHLQWIVRDISVRKDLDNLREDLIAMVYHDLRSPLANVVSSLGVLSTMFSDKENTTVNSLVGLALRSTERIQRLTNSLLDINRLEAGQSIGNRLPLSPLSLARDSVDEVINTAKAKGLAIDIDIPADLPRILVDEDMLRRVLINLLENAVRFTPTGGDIHIGGKRENGFVRIWVKDSGPGILPAFQEHIFEKFTRLSSKEGSRGLGLGLAFCRLAIEGHGGRIWVESEEGKGTNFVFLLPVVDVPG